MKLQVYANVMTRASVDDSKCTLTVEKVMSRGVNSRALAAQPKFGLSRVFTLRGTRSFHRCLIGGRVAGTSLLRPITDVQNRRAFSHYAPHAQSFRCSRLATTRQAAT